MCYIARTVYSGCMHEIETGIEAESLDGKLLSISSKNEPKTMVDIAESGVEVKSMKS
jgi:hypothetical protein